RIALDQRELGPFEPPHRGVEGRLLVLLPDRELSLVGRETEERKRENGEHQGEDHEPHEEESVLVGAMAMQGRSPGHGRLPASRRTVERYPPWAGRLAKRCSNH